MKRTILPTIMAILLAACGSDGGSTTAPDIPDFPDGAKYSVLERNNSIFLDETNNSVKLNNEGRMQGENLFFSTAGKRDGISYVTRIPTAPWNTYSDILKKGYGYIIGSKTEDGAMFTRLFVENIDTVTGNVKIISEAPFYGDGEKFYFNHKTPIFLSVERGDTIVVLTKPTTYNVELASGEWASIEPHITYIRLNFSENRSGEVRRDTLIFDNGRFDEARIPLIQLNYSLKDPILGI